MAASGFSNAGFAEAHANAEQRRITEQNNQADVALRTRALDQSASKGTSDDVNERINGTMKLVGSIIENAKAAGQPPEKIAANISAPLQIVGSLSRAIGRDPTQYFALTEAMLGTPSAPSTTDQKDYQFYSQQEQAAGRTPISFDDYSTRSKKAGATNIVMGGEAAFTSELGKLTAKEFTERRTGALDAAKSIENSRVARDLLDKGVVTGAGADWLLSFGKMLQAAGISEADDAIANTEAFGASRAKEVATVIKAFGSGTGLSDADREYALQAAAGKITMSEGSIRKVLEISDRASRNVLKLYNADASKIDRNVIPFDLTIPEPSAPTTPNAAPVTRTINGRTYFQRDGKWFDR